MKYTSAPAQMAKKPKLNTYTHTQNTHATARHKKKKPHHTKFNERRHDEQLTIHTVHIVGMINHCYQTVQIKISEVGKKLSAGKIWTPYLGAPWPLANQANSIVCVNLREYVSFLLLTEGYYH